MILLDEKHRVRAWVERRLEGRQWPIPFDRWWDAIGFENKREGLVGGLVYYELSEHHVKIAAAGIGSWLTPLRVKVIFLYPFYGLKVDHLAAEALRSNRKSRRLCRRLGFKQE